MKQLNTYIKEGLFDNTGVGVIKDKVEKWIDDNMRGMWRNFEVVEKNNKLIAKTKSLSVQHTDLKELTNGMFEWEVDGYVTLYDNKNLENLNGITTCEEITVEKCPALIDIDLSNIKMNNPDKKKETIFFEYCVNLNSVKLPEVNQVTFFNCFYLTKIECEKCNNIYFHRCAIKSLKDLKLPKQINILSIEECNWLKNLEGCPDIKNKLDVSSCKTLRSLKGCPDKIIEFTCSRNPKLTSLEGCPKEAKIFNCFGFDSLKYLYAKDKLIEEIKQYCKAEKISV